MNSPERLRGKETGSGQKAEPRSHGAHGTTGGNGAGTDAGTPEAPPPPLEDEENTLRNIGG